MLPILCFAYNIEIAVMPLHSSFEIKDKTGNIGFKVSTICILIAFFYYLFIVLLPYNKNYTISDKTEIETVLSTIGAGFQEIPKTMTYAILALICILQIPLTFNFAVE